MRNAELKAVICRLVLMFIVFFSINIQSASAQIISGQDIEAAALNRIERYLDDRGDFRRREVQFFHRINDTVVPDGQASIEVDMPGRINYAGVTSLVVRCRVDGRIVKSLNFTARIRIYDTVLTASHDLLYDKPISETDFRQEEIAVDGRNDYIKDFSVIKSLVPSYLIRAGSPVTINMFRQAMVIQTNQPVRLRIRYHGIEASAKGIAMARGRVGDMIRVKNESSGKIITGRVIDEQTVEVIY